MEEQKTQKIQEELISPKPKKVANKKEEFFDFNSWKIAN